MELTVNRRRGYRFRIYPSTEQRQKMARFAGCSRYVYNRLLAEQIARYEARKERIAAGDEEKREENKHLSKFDTMRLITKWRRNPETEFLSLAPYDVLSAEAIALDGAFQKFFKEKKGYPKFHRKQSSFSYTQPAKSVRFKADRMTITIPKVGEVKCSGYSEIEGKVKNISVSFDGARWFSSLQTEYEVNAPVHPSPKAVGIDRGVVHSVILSDGTVGLPDNEVKSYEARRRDLEERLKVLQRRSRNKRSPNRRAKQEASNRWKKEQQRISRLYAKMKDLRREHIHKITHNVSTQYSVVGIEALNVKAMSKSGKGSVDAHGVNVSAKRGLNRSIMSRAWGEIRRQLKYKSEWRGGMLVEVPARNTSRMCSECGFTSPDNRPSQAVFKCQSCGFSENADVNAAINIRELAIGAVD